MTGTDQPGADPPPTDQSQLPEEETEAYLPRFSRKRLSRRQWKWAIGSIVVSALTCATAVVVNVVKVPYVSLSPGSVYSAPDAIAVDDEGVPIFEPESEVGFVTVGVSQKLTLWRFFFDSLDDRIDIYKEEVINRGGTREETDQRNLELMRTSQKSAVTLALEFLGLTEVTLFPSLDTYECLYGDDSDSENSEPRPYIVFLPGDVVQSANGKTIDKTTDLLELVDNLPEGETVELEINGLVPPESEGSESEQSQPEESPQDDQTAGDSADNSNQSGIFTVEAEIEVTQRLERGAFFFNINFLEDTSTQNDTSGDDNATGEGDVSGEGDDANFKCRDQQSWFAYDSAEADLLESVRLDAGEVSGPSAGLAFTLSVIDLLSEGDLTGNLRVATTGVVNSNVSFYPIKFFREQRPECSFKYGKICSVGGVTQKTTAVRHNGYDVFLVPEDGNDYAEAASAAGDSLKVIEVSDLHEAIAVLECLGGDPVPVGSNYSDASTAQLPDCDSIR